MKRDLGKAKEEEEEEEEKEEEKTEPCVLRVVHLISKGLEEHQGD